MLQIFAYGKENSLIVLLCWLTKGKIDDSSVSLLCFILSYIIFPETVFSKYVHHGMDLLEAISLALFGRYSLFRLKHNFTLLFLNAITQIFILFFFW